MTEIVLFGITGDLSRQKLIPSLYNLFSKGALKPDTRFFGFGRKSMRDEEFQAFIETCVRSKSSHSVDVHLVDTLHQFMKQWSYVISELDSDNGYIELASRLKSDSSLVFLSLPPAFQLPVCKKLIENKVVEMSSINDAMISGAAESISASFGRKIALEKPYGHDSASAKELEAYLSSKLNQSQILRVDHYAGKQALVELERAAEQGVFQALLELKSIKSIEVTLCETADVSQRGAFYDSVGALNDVLQNHMLHMLSTVLALPQIGMTSSVPGHLSKIRSKILEAIEVTSVSALGQYAGYSTSDGVSSDSTTETFFNIEGRFGKHAASAIKIKLVGGKALKTSEASVIISLKNGKKVAIGVNGYGTKEAHEQIFEDAVAGNLDRFISYKQAMAGWRIVESAKKKHAGKKLVVYKKGTDSAKIK